MLENRISKILKVSIIKVDNIIYQIKMLTCLLTCKLSVSVWYNLVFATVEMTNKYAFEVFNLKCEHV